MKLARVARIGAEVARGWRHSRRNGRIYCGQASANLCPHRVVKRDVEILGLSIVPVYVEDHGVVYAKCVHVRVHLPNVLLERSAQDRVGSVPHRLDLQHQRQVR